MKVFADKQVMIVMGDYFKSKVCAMLLKKPMLLSITGIHHSFDIALKSLSKNDIDLVIVDPFSDDNVQQGLQFIEDVRRLHSSTKVLVYSNRFSENLIVSAFKRGADGYILFDEEPFELSRLVSEILDGGAPMSRKIATSLIRSYHLAPLSPLTRREHEVLNEASTGKNQKHIADTLNISTETVRSHMQNIFDKLNVRSKSDAISVARLQRLI
jgi:DNA-binding NarL/FixJ family response regulator